MLAELYKGAYRASNQAQLLERMRQTVIPRLTLLSFDRNTAPIYGQISATLEQAGQVLAHANLQIAATAMQHQLELVTGNLRHFERIPGLQINRVLAAARRSQ